MPVISFDIGELTKEQKEILAKEFPCQKENPNELPDGLVIIGGGE